MQVTVQKFYTNRLENLDDSFEKNDEVRPEWLIDDVSCDCMGVVWPYDGVWLR
jgi:hypothetical protein